MVKKNRDIGLTDLITSFAIAILLGYTLNPIFKSLEENYLWMIFGFSIGLIALGIVAVRISRIKRVSIVIFVLGITWFGQMTLLICDWVSTPIF